ncbi:hypothetical protein NUU61_010063 [Penicillium alfredii]|uniref:F-box domain-containing protein n=1 Tax=Penicillium alfredii TaxID=1506179 RepID=A0A9W9EHB3_9EURO|nr:uncharacterized protein NUU61_010063 [Penicillium alfredii]KAJ5081799.1 hypothetical protein NUU61_010063 [Penicillium alfredii]
MTAAPAVTVDSLPNEIFVQILSEFSTRALLPLATVCRRFHALVLRIIHYRLLVDTSLREYQLLLECFHPSSKLTEPHVFCKHIGTDGLSDQDNELEIDPAQQLGRLTGLYSRFRPEARDEDKASRVPSSGRTPHTGSGGVTSGSCANTNGTDTGVTREVNLEGFEDFSQLCVVVNLVQVMPGTSLLLSALNIEDGVIRLWREWLRKQCDWWKATAEQAKEEGSMAQIPQDWDDMLWVDQHKTVGLKMRVRAKAWNPAFPILMHHDDRDEGAWVGYEVDLRELHIRSTRLLLTVEQSQEEQQQYQNNAVIFGAYPAPVA